MPSLICSSRYTVDSQILRRAAQQLGWETLRLDGNTIPDWFDPPDRDFAMFYTAPHAFDIATQLNRTLLGCNPSWTVSLPSSFLNRELTQTSLADALTITSPRFVKHSVSKAFPAAVYTSGVLLDATRSIDPECLVHVGEPVEWQHEFRCFIGDRRVLTMSPYVYDGAVVADYDSFPTIPHSLADEVVQFAESVLAHPDVTSPPAFVLDVGVIAGRGWSVVECNECWASGIYACDPNHVLQSLLRANIDSGTLDNRRWDFAVHYAVASNRSG